ncbi:MAG TPA: aldo/keto reductase [Steroidobacteraceae bacterium]|nr:aldo/keto reductase [Steroidobacteraceae bacterium]
MNAVAQQALRTRGWSADEPALLAPESARILASGHRMPLLGLGTWQLTMHTVPSICNALELGFRMIDTCPDYHTQRGIGDAIRACGFERDAVFVITKVAPDEDAYEALGRSLAQLKLDHVDLALIREPPQLGVGEKAWQGLRRAKRAGLTRDIGVSSYSIDCIEELVYRSGEMPAVNQIEWSPFGHSPRMLDFCRDNDIVIQAWSPLTRARRLNDDKVASMAARYGKTAAQLLLRWNLQLGVVPLPKANHVTHQRENLHLFDFEILPQDMTRLNALNEHYSARGKLVYL